MRVTTFYFITLSTWQFLLSKFPTDPEKNVYYVENNKLSIWWWFSFLFVVSVDVLINGI